MTLSPHLTPSAAMSLARLRHDDGEGRPAPRWLCRRSAARPAWLLRAAGPPRIPARGGIGDSGPSEGVPPPAADLPGVGPVGSFGGYADLRNVIRYITTGVHTFRGGQPEPDRAPDS